MKNRVFLTLSMLVAMVCASCQKGDNGIDGEGTISPYFFTGILKPTQLQIHPISSSGVEHNTTLQVTLTGKFYTPYNSNTHDEFETLARAIGDLPQKEGYVHATPADNLTISTSIEKVSIVAVSKYNDTHPEGSSLNDIATLSYSFFDPEFGKKVHSVSPETTRRDIRQTPKITDLSPIRHPALGFRQYTRLSKILEIEAFVMYLELTAPPSVPTQRISVLLQLGDGRELRGEVELNTATPNTLP